MNSPWDDPPVDTSGIDIAIGLCFVVAICIVFWAIYEDHQCEKQERREENHKIKICHPYPVESTYWHEGREYIVCGETEGRLIDNE